MNKKSFWYRAFDLYYDGFRSMTLGKKLWLVIFIKLFIMFAILKVFFFPNFLKGRLCVAHARPTPKIVAAIVNWGNWAWRRLADRTPQKGKSHNTRK